MNKYSVSDLSKIIGVPRTTINDWLNRYSQYIDFKMQGKRKIYLDATVSVLQEISQLREQGMSSFDIEEELEKRHPVHGEVTSPEENTPAAAATPEKVESEEVAPETTGSEIVVKNNSQEFAMIAKQQSDELAQLITDHLRNMTQRIDDIEEISKLNAAKVKRRYSFSFAAVAVLVIIGAVLGALTFKKLDKNLLSLKDENKNLREDFDGKYTQLNKEKESLLQVKDELNNKINDADKVLALTKKELGTTINKTEELEKSLNSQRQNFEEMLTQEKSEKAKKEAEILKIREQYAAKIFKQLKSLEEATRKGTVKDELIHKLQQQIEARGTAIDKLRQEKENALAALSEKSKQATKTETDKPTSAEKSDVSKKNADLPEKLQPKKETLPQDRSEKKKRVSTL